MRNRDRDCIVGSVIFSSLCAFVSVISGLAFWNGSAIGLSGNQIYAVPFFSTLAFIPTLCGMFYLYTKCFNDPVVPEEPVIVQVGIPV